MAHEDIPAELGASGLLLKLRGNSRTAPSFAARELSRTGETLLEVGTETNAFGLSEAAPAHWVRIAASDNPWEQAHAMLRMGLAVGSGDLMAAEPDIIQQWEDDRQTDPREPCRAEPQSDAGGRAMGPHDRWHLDEGYSGLAAARAAVSAEAQRRVTIAHLDTGYDPEHAFKPAHLAPRQYSFIAGEPHNSAEDCTPAGGMLRNHGHGTGTIGILAAPGIGGAPDATILPIRIANSVVRFTTGTMAQGFDCALREGAQVLSMSMGGLASGILADAVNRCYAAGLVMVTAAGNNFGGLPVQSIVYPARMRRVVAACGIMADMRSYSGLDERTMQGCYGPRSKMATAVSGFTPNIPWPQIGCRDVVDEDGGGTSSATPQLAAAVALWMARYWDQLRALPQPWMRGEAARQALFRSASMAGGDPDPKLGWGAVRAAAMLDMPPLAPHELVPAPKASAGWAWLKLLSGRGVGAAEAGMSGVERLLAIELAQLAQRDPEAARILNDPDVDPDEGDPGDELQRRFLEAAEASPLASRPLKQALAMKLHGAGPAAKAPPPAPPVIRRAGGAPTAPGADLPGGALAPTPQRRRLQVFALDPSLGASLNSYEDQIATISVRNEKDLKPGPVGEYVEVVDVDPGSNLFYPPVDLNHPNLLLQDGLPPSEGNPGFHQQMVYAVAMHTIENFERALGRDAHWRGHWSGTKGEDDQFVRRLRIYPHALRQENAYYSPDKKALLFGYFPANSQKTDLTPPGTMVFSCLSADIIAHETTHALLDGQARTFTEASNPDVRAFHEGFADIVALFQQFSYRDLVRRQIAQARGDLSAARLLGKLAQQFGEATSKGGALRSYPELPPNVSYETTMGFHARGSILVAAVYRAFLAIVETRTADLVRLATGGTGVLPAGALHPDLVERLTDEATRAARHVLKMCIRALDYAPPVDITFGEYLRALITADVDHEPEDSFNYRIAFLEAFRKYQLLPRQLRTVSVETLRWREPLNARPAWLEPALKALNIDVTDRMTREETFRRSEERRGTMSKHVVAALRHQEDCDPLGLQFDLPQYGRLESPGEIGGTTLRVDNVRISTRIGSNGKLAAQLIMVLRQRRPELLHDGGSDERFWFRGGTTLIVDLLRPEGPRIRYSIRKPMRSVERLARERAYRRGDGERSLRATYFGAWDRMGLEEREPFAIMHASKEEE